MLFEPRRASALQREGKEGVRQEGVAAKIHGHDSTIAILHEVGKMQVRYTEGQALAFDLRPKVNAYAPPGDA